MGRTELYTATHDVRKHSGARQSVRALCSGLTLACCLLITGVRPAHAQAIGEVGPAGAPDVPEIIDIRTREPARLAGDGRASAGGSGTPHRRGPR